jgi:hypothetical protein
MEGEGGKKRGESAMFDHYDVGFSLILRPLSLALPAFLLNAVGAVWRSLLLTLPCPVLHGLYLSPLKLDSNAIMVMALCFRW